MPPAVPDMPDLTGAFAAAATAPRESPLALYFAGGYFLLIVYASLQPFAGWTAPPADSPFFLVAARFPRFNPGDFWINLAAYVPFGFLIALALGPKRGTPSRIALSTTVCFVVSLTMEAAQTFLPSRVASVPDLLTNSLGGLVGAIVAAVTLGHPRARNALFDWRHRLFIEGRIGDIGLTLLVLWLFAQFNPAIPLFASTWDPIGAPASDWADRLIESAEIAFNVVGVGLFLSLLLRNRAFVGPAFVLVAATCLAAKTIGAAALLHPVGWQFWLRPTVTLGISAGLLLIFATVWTAPAPRSILCTVALLSALGTQLLVPEVISAAPPRGLFNWQHGQLVNFNGLTRTLLMAWPVAAAIFLAFLHAHVPGREGGHAPV